MGGVGRRRWEGKHKSPYRALAGPEGPVSEKTGGRRLVFSLGHTWVDLLEEALRP